MIERSPTFKLAAGPMKYRVLVTASEAEMVRCTKAKAAGQAITLSGYDADKGDLRRFTGVARGLRHLKESKWWLVVMLDATAGANMVMERVVDWGVPLA
jgi:hypothetical protein